MNIGLRTLAKTPFVSRIESSVVIGTVLVVFLFSLTTHGAWIADLPSILTLTAEVGIVAIGQALLMTAGEVDLSVGAVFAFAAVAFVTLMYGNLGVIPSALLAIAVATLIGLVNGLITVRFRVASMIVTLGAMFVFRGLVYLLTTGSSLSIPRPYRHDSLIQVAGGQTYFISNSVFVLVILMIFFTFVLSRTRLGGHILAVGGDPHSALANGVSPARVKTIAFALCSALTAVSGIIAACQDGAVYSTSGHFLELDTIAAAVIGGCTLRGGVGSVWGSVLGVFVLSSFKGGLMMLGAPPSWYIAFVGMILVGFLVATKLVSRRMSKQFP